MKEAFLDPRMYACADYYASSYASQVLDDLYTLWVEWKNDNPTDNPQELETAYRDMSHRFTTKWKEDDFGD